MQDAGGIEKYLLQPGLEQPSWLPEKHRDFILTYQHRRDEGRLSPRLNVLYSVPNSVFCYDLEWIPHISGARKEGDRFSFYPNTHFTVSPGKYIGEYGELKGGMAELFKNMQTDAFMYIGDVPEMDIEKIQLFGGFAHLYFVYGMENGDFDELYREMEKTPRSIVVPQSWGAQRQGGSGLILPR